MLTLGAAGTQGFFSAVDNQYTELWTPPIADFDSFPIPDASDKATFSSGMCRLPNVVVCENRWRR